VETSAVANVRVGIAARNGASNIAVLLDLLADRMHQTKVPSQPKLNLFG
jgi:hypothetical protein